MASERKARAVPCEVCESAAKAVEATRQGFAAALRTSEHEYERAGVIRASCTHAPSPAAPQPSETALTRELVDAVNEFVAAQRPMDPELRAVIEKHGLTLSSLRGMGEQLAKETGSAIDTISPEDAWLIAHGREDLCTMLERNLANRLEAVLAERDALATRLHVVANLVSTFSEAVGADPITGKVVELLGCYREALGSLASAVNERDALAALPSTPPA